MPTSKCIYHPSKQEIRPIFDSRVLFCRLGLLHNEQENIVDKIRHGFSVLVIDNLYKELDIPLKSFLKYIGLSSATLTRRRKEKYLNLQESNRVYRIAIAYRDALELFDGDTKAAGTWLNRPEKSLGGNTPLEYLDTEAGLQKVHDLIGRLEHGIIT